VLRVGLDAKPERRFPSMDALLQTLRVHLRRQLVVVAGAAAGVTALTLGALLFVWLRPAPGPVCADGSAELASAWSEPMQRRAEQAMLSTQRSFAPTTWRRVQKRLDGYGRSWARAQEEACLATRVRATQSAEVLALRQACLHDGLLSFTALVQALGVAQPTHLERATYAVTKLPDLTACADPRALQERWAPRVEASSRARAESLAVASAALVAQASLEPSTEVAGKLEALLQEARTLREPRLEQRLLRRLAEVWDELGDAAKAQALRIDAQEKALARVDDRAVVALSAELFTRSAATASSEQKEQWLQRAEAALQRLGNPRALEALWLQARAVGPLAELRVLEALPHARKAVSLYKDDLSPASATAHAQLGALLEAKGSLREARPLYERALTLSRTGFGAHDERSLAALYALARLRSALGDDAEAEAAAREGLELASAHREEKRALRIQSLRVLGEVLLAAGKPREAVDALRQAVALNAEHPAAEGLLVARLRLELGRSLFAAGEARAGREHLRAAQKLLQKSPDAGPEALRAAVAVTLAERGTSRRRTARGFLSRLETKALEKTALRTLGDQAMLQWLAGRETEAAKTFDQQAALLEVAMGADAPALAAPLEGAGLAYADAGKSQEAFARLNRAAPLTRASGRRFEDHARVQFALAKAQYAVDRDRLRATARIRALQSRLEPVEDPRLQDLKTQVKGWLDRVDAQLRREIKRERLRNNG
jgi:hypothetical protein